MINCTKCDLCKTRKNIVPGEGPIPAEVLLLGEAPGQAEDISARPFVGSAGRVLNKMLTAAGFDRSQVYVDNIVHCRPIAPTGADKENRPPTSDEIELCCSYFEEIVQQVKPKVIVALGNVPLKYLLNDRGANISKKRGQFFWSDKYQCHICPVYHPAAVIRKYEWYPVSVEDFKRIKLFLSGGVPTKLQTTYTLVDTIEKLNTFFQTAAEQPAFAYDIETTDLDFTKERIICISFSWQEGTGYVVPLLNPSGANFWDDSTQLSVHTRLKDLFLNSAIKIAQNGKFDTLFLKQNGIEVHNFCFDTMLAHYLLDENMEHGLKELAWIFTDMGGYERGLQVYQKEYKMGHSMLGIPYETMLPYSAGDADCTFRLWKKFAPMLEEQGLTKLMNKIVMPLDNVLIETEFRGVQVDTVYLQQLDKKFSEDLGTIQQKIYQSVGHELNLNSPKQLQNLLFTELNLPSIKQTKTGHSTDEEVLKILASRHPVAKTLLDYRKVQKLLSTYVRGLEYDSNFRVHTDYSLSRTATGRLASSGPNLQNIPHTDEMKNIFVAKPGYTLVAADFSQAEFRWWAHYSGDEKMILDIRNGMDIHKKVASVVFNVPVDQVSKEQRRTAKMVVFGLMYGRGSRSVAEEYKISIRQAEKIIDTFFSWYPKAQRWLDTIVLQAKRDKQLKSFFGRVRRLPTLDSPDEQARAQAERQAKNFPIQSAAADMTNWVGIRLYPILQPIGTFLVLNVHDCLVYETPESLGEQVANIVQTEATRPIKGCLVPMAVETHIGRSWGGQKLYEQKA